MSTQNLTKMKPKKKTNIIDMTFVYNFHLLYSRDGFTASMNSRVAGSISIQSNGSRVNEIIISFGFPMDE